MKPPEFRTKEEERKLLRKELNLVGKIAVVLSIVPMCIGILFLIMGIGEDEPLAVLGASIPATGFFTLTLALIGYGLYCEIRYSK
ncbi:hypothetical protein [Halostagnicola bangensis]